MGGKAKYGTSKFQAMRFLLLANSKRLSGVWNNLKNITLLGTENYPKTPTAAYNIIFWNKELTPPRPQEPPSEVALLQSNNPNITAVPGSNGNLFMDVNCY